MSRTSKPRLLQAGQVFYFNVNPQRHKAIRYGS